MNWQKCLLYLIVLIQMIICISDRLKADDGVAIYNEVVAAASVSTPEGIEDSIDVMQRLFKGGSYKQVMDVSNALLENKYFQPIPPIQKPVIADSMTADDIKVVEDQYNFVQSGRIARQLLREMLRFYHARSLYEEYKLEYNTDLLYRAIDEFLLLGNNAYGFQEQQYQAQAYYWAANGYMLLEDYVSAINNYREVAKYNPSPEIDIKTSLELADALTAQAEVVGDKSSDQPGRSPQDLPDNPAEVLKTREELLREAERELSKITTDNSRSDYLSGVELRLIELRYKLHEYEDAFRLADIFLSRATPGSKEYALASYYRAMSVYSQGDINQSVELFKQALEENEDSGFKAKLFYGYGWTNAQLARTAGPEQRLVYLTRSQNALEAAIELMPFSNQRNKAILELTDVLIKSGDYEQAANTVKEVLNVPDRRIEANFYAGLATKKMDAIDEASRYFHTVLELSEAYVNKKYVLETLNELADLERIRGSYAEALEYYKEARDEAVKQLQYDIVAVASLGMATAEAELGYYDEQKREGAAERLLDSVIDMSLAVRKSEPADIKTAARVVAFRAKALEEWSNANSENLNLALQTLNSLQGRLLPRLRKDELEYVYGRIYYLKAQNLKRDIVIDYKTQLGEFDDVFDDYRQAEEIILRALEANPRGDLSAQTRYLLGLVYYSYASLKLELAELQKSRGMGASAPPLEKEGVETFRKAIAPLNLAVNAAENKPALRIQARELLGSTYLAIGKYSGSISKEFSQFEKGLDEFRILAGEPSITQEQKLDAIINMAVAYSENNRKHEAYNTLKPYINRSIRAAIFAGKMMIALKQPRIAFHTLESGIKSALQERHPDDEGIAEAMFMAYSLGIKQTDDIAENAAEIDKYKNLSANGLFELGQKYPGTVWASRALLELGEWLLEQGQWQLALEKSVMGIDKLKGDLNAIDTVQAMYLLKGKALMEGGRKEKENTLFHDALRAFAQAERANTRTELGNKQRALSIFEQGEALLALNQVDDALRYFGRVFSLFHNQFVEADMARYAAAKIHESNHNYDLAIKLYDEMFDKAKYIDDKLRVVNLANEEKQ